MTDITPLFDSPRALIESARDHITDLKVRLDEFMKSGALDMIFEPDPQSSDQILKFKLLKPIPSRIKVRVFNVASELRASLDHAVYASAVALGTPDPRRTKFPFGDTAAQLEDDIARGCRDVPIEILALARTFEPYEAGDKTLWGLNKLRNVKNHKRLLQPSPAVEFVDYDGNAVNPVGSGGDAVIRWLKPVWNAAKQEIPLVAMPDGVHFEIKVKMRTDIAFDQAPGLQGRFVFGALNTLAGKIESIVMAIEAETLRIITTSTPDA